MTPLTDESNSQRPIRLWPAVVIATLFLLVRFVLPIALPEAMPIGVMAGPVSGLAILIWWLFFSRARKSDRWLALGVMIAALLATRWVIHPSIAGGAMGFLFPAYAIPTLGLAFVAWAIVSRNFSDRTRRGSMVATILLACGSWALVRTGGFSTDFNNDWAWRWTPTPEDRLLARQERLSTPRPPLKEEMTGATWSGFRGHNRDGVVRGVRIETDWTAMPPVETWRRQVGPAWSSVAVNAGRLYTQEQRGEDEVVACYDLATGAPLWQHGDPARFWESNAGPGPRGTPTLHAGRVYSMGATGIINALDAVTGERAWSRNAASDTKTEIPDWGLSSSPLVVGDLVVVAVTGTLAGYDLATGAPRWTGPSGDKCYSSPHSLEIDGVPQIVLMNGAGCTSVAPADGKVLWQHAWPGFAVVQPAQIAGGSLLISTGDRTGARRIDVANTPDGWSVEERWTSNRLKAYFNDFVLHRGHAYGFDGGFLACVSVEDGARRWKGGRYGGGQLVLLADQDVLLVVSEQGDLALVGATVEGFAELARFKGLEGKTWNHPVLAGDVLIVRNDREMAAFKLRLHGG